MGITGKPPNWVAPPFLPRRTPALSTLSSYITIVRVNTNRSWNYVIATKTPSVPDRMWRGIVLRRFRDWVGTLKPDAARVEYLRWDSENSNVLSDYALDLAPDDKIRIHTILARATEPIDSSLILAEEFSRFGDQAGLDAMLSYLENQGSAAAELDYVNGLIHELRGDDAAAAELFLAALEQQKDQSEHRGYFWKFCECQIRLGDVLRAYEFAPDADAAFGYLALGDYDEGGDSPLPPDLLRELAEAHRERSPQDPWWAYHLGNLHCRDDDFEDAERLYRIGLDNLPDDDEYSDAGWALETRLAECLVAAGRWREAYDLRETPADSFATLAGEFFWREQDDLLRELVRLHRNLHPEDAMGWLYAGRLALRERSFDDAESLLDEAWTRLDPENMNDYQIRAARVDLYIAAGRALEAYGNVPPDRDTFSQLAEHFLAKHEFEPLEDLIKLRLQDAPDDARPFFYRVKASFQQDEYADVLETMTGLQADFEESLESYRRSDWEFMHLRSLLRTGRSSEAVELARAISERQHDSKALIVALCCSDQHEEALELLPDFNDTSYRSIYNDPDAGRILRSEAFRPARESAPPEIPDLSTTPIVMLLDRPLLLSIDDLAPIVDRLFGSDARIEPLLNPDDAETTAFVVSTKESEFLVAAGKGRYQEDFTQLRAGLFADVRRWEAVAGHQAWCAVSLIDEPEDGQLASQPLIDLRNFAGELVGEQWLGLYDGSASRILVPSDGPPDLLLAPDPDQNSVAAGESLWMYRLSSNIERDTILRERVQRLLHGAIRQWSASRHECTLDIVASISAEPTGELIQMRVESIERGAYAGWVLGGRLTDAPQLVPWLQSGDPIRVNSWSVVDWTLTTATGPSNARTEAEQWWEQTRGGYATRKETPETETEKRTSP